MICVSCKKKKKCTVKGVVNMLVASRKLGLVEELTNLKITSKRDVMGLGLERGLEIILLQLLAFQQSMDERLMTIEE